MDALSEYVFMDALLTRIQRLEDIDAIRQLKARYLHACDRKQIDAVRDCFADGEVMIDYGAIGSFNNREDFLAVYQEKACRPNIIDMHHSHNGQIQWQSAEAATGTWDLYFYQIDTDTGTLIQLGGFYEDRYIKQDDAWKLVETRFNVTSTQVSHVADGELKPLFSGVAPPPI